MGQPIIIKRNITLEILPVPKKNNSKGKKLKSSTKPPNN